MKEKLISIALGAVGSALAAVVSHYSGVQITAGGAETVVVGSFTPMAVQALKGAFAVA